MGLLKQGLVIVFILVTYNFLCRFLEPDLPVVVDGFCHPAFEPVCKLFRENVASGKEKGAAFAVYHRGELVVDVWGGYADLQASRPWRKDTMTMVFSVSKGVAAIVIATLVNKGLLDYKQPVYKYWPEFGQADKKNITVEMLLSHQAGLAAISDSISLRDLIDNPEKTEKILASQRTLWPAGQKFGYHSLTYGLYVDTLVRKVDPKGRNMTRVFLEDIARPHGLDMFMNAPKEQFHRVARIHFTPIWQILLQALFYPKYLSLFGKVTFDPGALISKAGKAVKEYEDMNTLNDPYHREATLSSASVTATARGVAKLYGILTKDGTEADNALMSKELVKRLSTAVISGTDQCLGVNMSLGPGVAVRDREGEPIFGHSGHGGSNAVANPSKHLAIAYVTNFISMFGFGDDPRFISLEDMVYKCLDEYLKVK